VAALAPRQSVARVWQQRKAVCSTARLVRKSLSPGSTAPRSRSIFVQFCTSEFYHFHTGGFFSHTYLMVQPHVTFPSQSFVYSSTSVIALYYCETVKFVSAFYGRCSGVRTISLAVCRLVTVSRCVAGCLGERTVPGSRVAKLQVAQFLDRFFHGFVQEHPCGELSRPRQTVLSSRRHSAERG